MMDDGVRRRWLRIGGLVVVAIGLFLIVALVLRHGNGAHKDNRQYDKYSGETVSTINGKSPELNSSGTAGPLYLGFSLLIDKGFSQTQLSALEDGYKPFLSQRHYSATVRISLYKTTYHDAGPAPDDDSVDMVGFTTVINNKDMYRTELEPSGLDDIKMRLYDTSGQPVYSYDSAAVSSDTAAE